MGKFQYTDRRLQQMGRGEQSRERKFAVSGKTQIAEGVRRRNEILLDDYYDDLRKRGVPAGMALTRRKQVEAYLNTYLLAACGEQMEQGSRALPKYIRNYYPRARAGINGAEIREICESIRLFYCLMQEEGYLEKKCLDSFNRRFWYAVHVQAGRCLGAGRKRKEKRGTKSRREKKA